jgi:hypothetical protein
MLIDSRITRNFALRPDGDDGDGAPPPPPAPPESKPEAKDDQAAAFAEMRRALKAEQKRAAELEAKVAERERAEAEQQGRWKELAEAAEAKAAALEAKLQQGEQRMVVAGVAKRLQFVDPDDAHRFLDATDMADEKLAEAALKSLAKSKPYLLAKAPTRTGREITGEREIPKTPDGKPDFQAIAGSVVLHAATEARERRGSGPFVIAEE